MDGQLLNKDSCSLSEVVESQKKKKVQLTLRAPPGIPLKVPGENHPSSQRQVTFIFLSGIQSLTFRIAALPIFLM